MTPFAETAVDDYAEQRAGQIEYWTSQNGVTYSAEPGSNSETLVVDLERWSATRAKLAPVGTDAPP
jgi:hypothetical protein